MKKLLTVVVALMVAMLPVLAFAADKTNTKVTLTGSMAEKGFEALSKLKIEASLDQGENPALAFDVLFDGKSVLNMRIWPNKDLSTIYSQSNLFGDKVFSVDVTDLIALMTAALAEIENQLGGIDIAAMISKEAIIEGIKELFTKDAKTEEAAEEAKIEETAENLVSKLIGNIDFSKLDFSPVLKNLEALAAKATETEVKDYNIDFSTEKLGVDPEYKLEIKAPVAKVGELVLEKADVSAFINSILEVAGKIVSIVDTKEVLKMVDEFLDKQIDLKNITLHSLMNEKGELLGIDVQLNAGEGDKAGSLDIDFCFAPDEANKINKFCFQVSVSGIGENHTENAVPILAIAAANSIDKATPNDGLIVFALGNEAVGHFLITGGHSTDASTKGSATAVGLKLTSDKGEQILSGNLVFTAKEDGSFDIVVFMNGKECARLDAKVETVDSVPNPDTKDAIAVLKLSDEEKAALQEQMVESASGALLGALTLLAA